MSATRALWSEDGTLRLDGDGVRRPIEALLFDLGGTLDADGVGWGERFERLLLRELPELPPSPLAEALAAAEQTVLQHPRAPELGLAEMISLHVTTQLDRLHASDAGRAARVAKSFFEETHAALARRRPLLERLARRLPLGVVSNGCGNTERLLEECGLATLFRVVVDSSRVNAWKPDPRILEPALAALALPAARVAMVGDRLDRDVEAAAAAGLLSIWVAGGRPLDRSHPMAAAVDLVVDRVEALDPEFAP